MSRPRCARRAGPAALSRAGAAAVAGVLVAAALPPAAAAQAVLGRMLPVQGERGIADVSVTLLDARGERVASAVSAADGAFRIPVRRLGWYRLHASHSAHHDTIVGPLQFGPNRVAGVAIRLRPLAFALDALHAEAGAGQRAAALAATAGDGVARLDAASIGALRLRHLSDLLGTLDGVRLVAAAGGGGPTLAVFGQACVPQIELDGHVVTPGGRAHFEAGRVSAVELDGQVTPPGDHAPDNFASPSRLRHVEVFPPQATMPSAAAGRAVPCALIRLGTR
jgi:hypothetical protein